MASSLNRTRFPVWPAILFLLWNLMGCAAFVLQSTMDLAELAKSDPLQADIWAAMPLWAWAAYLIAVVAGTLGAIALLLRRGVAVPLSALCLVAVLVQFSYTFFLTDLFDQRGITAGLFPLAIILIALGQTLYAVAAGKKGALR
jgi:hypothetical protein